MSSTQYLLKNNLLADLSYFSVSKKQDKTARIILNSVTYNHDKKHYTLSYWEDTVTKHLRALRVKSLTIYGFKDYKKVHRTIERDGIFDFIDELKQVSTKVYLPNKESAIDFSTNWIKGKNVVLIGRLFDGERKPINIHQRINPVIERLGGHPKPQMGANTDMLITFGDCSNTAQWEFAQKNDIPTANLVEFMDLVESEFQKNLAEVIEDSFLVFM
jgi:NAD-dependent DNA ligase